MNFTEDQQEVALAFYDDYVVSYIENINPLIQSHRQLLTIENFGMSGWIPTTEWKKLLNSRQRVMRSISEQDDTLFDSFKTLLLENQHPDDIEIFRSLRARDRLARPTVYGATGHSFFDIIQSILRLSLTESDKASLRSLMQSYNNMVKPALLQIERHNLNFKIQKDNALSKMGFDPAIPIGVLHELESDRAKRAVDEIKNKTYSVYYKCGVSIAKANKSLYLNTITNLDPYLAEQFRNNVWSRIARDKVGLRDNELKSLDSLLYIFNSTEYKDSQYTESDKADITKFINELSGFIHKQTQLCIDRAILYAEEDFGGEPTRELGTQIILDGRKLEAWLKELDDRKLPDFIKGHLASSRPTSKPTIKKKRQVDSRRVKSVDRSELNPASEMAFLTLVEQLDVNNLDHDSILSLFSQYTSRCKDLAFKINFSPNDFPSREVLDQYTSEIRTKTKRLDNELNTLTEEIKEHQAWNATQLWLIDQWRYSQYRDLFKRAKSTIRSGLNRSETIDLVELASGEIEIPVDDENVRTLLTQYAADLTEFYRKKSDFDIERMYQRVILGFIPGFTYEDRQRVLGPSQREYDGKTVEIAFLNQRYLDLLIDALPEQQSQILNQAYIRKAYPDVLSHGYERARYQLQIALSNRNLLQHQVEQFAELDNRLSEIQNGLIAVANMAPVNAENNMILRKQIQNAFSDMLFERNELTKYIERLLLNLS